MILIVPLPKRVAGAPSPALIVRFPNSLAPSPAQTSSLPTNILHNKLAPNIPNNMPKNPSFCSFASFSTVYE